MKRTKFDETIARLLEEGALSPDDDPAPEPDKETPPAAPRRNALVFLPSPHEHDLYPA